MTTTIHNTKLCTCEQCQWADEQEAETVCTDIDLVLALPDLQTRLEEGERLRRAAHQTRWIKLSSVSAAIFETLDEGDPVGHSWLFFRGDESDYQTERRYRFVEQVINRLRK